MTDLRHVLNAKRAPDSPGKDMHDTPRKRTHTVWPNTEVRGQRCEVKNHKYTHQRSPDRAVITATRIQKGVQGMQFLISDLVCAAQVAQRTQSQNEVRNLERIVCLERIVAERTRVQAHEREREQAATDRARFVRSATPPFRSDVRYVRSPTPPFNPPEK